MTTQLMVSALRQGKTGTEILDILDAITSNNYDYDADVAGGYAALSDDEDTAFVHMPILNQNVPTLEEIAF